MTSARREAMSAPRPPVVVTFDAQGEVSDVVGDIGWFAGGQNMAEDLYRRLSALREGAGGTPEVIPAVELSQGRYADIHIVAEEDSQHFVLRDATTLMEALRRSQQTSHQAVLQEARDRRRVRAKRDAVPASGPLQPFRRHAELYAEMVHGARAPLALLAGHVRALQQRCQQDPAALRSLAAIQHAAVQLDLLSTNALIALAGSGAGVGDPCTVELPQLAALLQDTFGLQAKARSVAFEVLVPAYAPSIRIDAVALRQLLINLVVHAFEGLQDGPLRVSLRVGTQGLEIEVGSGAGGFDAAHFGPLVTTGELLSSHPQGSLGLAVSQQLLAQMRAAIELVPCLAGGHELWIRLPLDGTGDPGAESGP